MTEHSKISPQGHAIVPAAMCVQMNWPPGTAIEIEMNGESVTIRPKPAPRKTITFAEFQRRNPPHEGPPLTLDQMDAAVAQEAARRLGSR